MIYFCFLTIQSNLWIKFYLFSFCFLQYVALKPNQQLVSLARIYSSVNIFRKKSLERLETSTEKSYRKVTFRLYNHTQIPILESWKIKTPHSTSTMFATFAPIWRLLFRTKWRLTSRPNPTGAFRVAWPSWAAIASATWSRHTEPQKISRSSIDILNKNCKNRITLNQTKHQTKNKNNESNP